MPGYLPACAKRVGVFVNESKENILMYTDRFGLDYIQLHGNEAPEYCRSLRNAGLHLIKAFSILLPKDLLSVSAYNGLCDYYLFDTKTPQYGGSGNQFDWNLLHRYNGPTSFLLSGGINPYSVKACGSSATPISQVSISTAVSKRTGNKGCGTHLKLPERTRWVYYLTIYDLPCTMYNLPCGVHCAAK